MIDTRQVFAPSEEVVKKAREVSVERLSDNKYRVTPNDKTKAVRIVEFEFIEDREFIEDEGVMIDCYAEDSCEGCPGNDHRKLCYHALSVLMSQEETPA